VASTQEVAVNESQKQDEQIDGLPALEVECQNCAGRGHSLRGHWDRCVPCEGTGYIPTPAGLRILRLIAHKFGPVQKQEDLG
jgi:RecJ-like exonuclease